MNEPGEITRLLQDYEKGNREAMDEVFPLVYEELRRLAASRLRGERGDHTLQPTALVHEAYLRLIEQHSASWRNRAHFFGLAAEMMRRILVNHALGKNRVKRFGNQTKIALDEALDFAKTQEIDVVELDEALNELEKFDLRQAKIVELKFFAGLTTAEIAEIVEISDSTVKREWRIARAWLRDRLRTG